MKDPATPKIVGRAEWERARAELLAREKAHTHAGDALAAARRRLPMTRMPSVTLVGAHGPLPLHEVFEGRRQLLVYHFMWKRGASHDKQCPGCTHTQVALNEQVRAYLAARDVQYAVFCAGPWDEIAAYRDFMGWSMPWYACADTGSALPDIRNGGDLRCYLREGGAVYQTYETTGRGVEAMLPSLQLLDFTPWGRQESWEDSPAGWPQPDEAAAWWWQSGRPVAQWTRTAAPAK